MSPTTLSSAPVAWTSTVPTNLVALTWERHRRFVVRIILAVYWLLIFEGALRKWVLPQFGRILFFVRDPLVLLVYALVLTRRTRLRSPWLETGVGLGIASFVLVIGHAVFNGAVPVYLALYGWRNYFFYLPLAFIIGSYFQKRDLENVARKTLIIAIPMAILVSAEFSAPTYAPINAGSGESFEDQYTTWNVPGGYVRPMGTFTSSLGLTGFVASSVALAFGVWLTPGTALWFKRHWLLVATGAILTLLGLGGSRGAIVWSGIVIYGTIAGLTLLGNKIGLKAIIVSTVFVLVGIITLPIAFPAATEAFTQRWIGAGEAEGRAYGSGGIFARVAYESLSFRYLTAQTPLLGYGLGSAGNAAWRVGARDEIIPFATQDQINAAETDWGRNILELGPIFGFFFIAYRIGFAIWLAKQSLAATRTSGDLFPLVLCSFVGQLIFSGEMTAHGTMNGYAWLFTGFCMAAIHQCTSSVRPVYRTWSRFGKTNPSLRYPFC